MRNFIYFKKFIIFIIIFFVCNQNIAQKINIDSLLTIIVNDMKVEKNYQNNIERGLLGKKIAPNYLDYYLLLGRNHEMLQQKDSAIYYYKYVINKNSKYEDAHLYLINFQLVNQDYANAAISIDKTIAIYPNKKYYELKKAELFELQKEEKIKYEYIKILQKKYPDEDSLK